jgi:hypothetical protein
MLMIGLSRMSGRLSRPVLRGGRGGNASSLPDWGGFTTRDLTRCRLMARMVALVYNWWTLFVRLAQPHKHFEAITSRPLLLHGVATQTRHAGQTRRFSAGTPHRLGSSRAARRVATARQAGGTCARASEMAYSRDVIAENRFQKGWSLRQARRRTVPDGTAVVAMGHRHYSIGGRNAKPVGRRRPFASDLRRISATVQLGTAPCGSSFIPCPDIAGGDWRRLGNRVVDACDADGGGHCLNFKNYKLRKKRPALSKVSRRLDTSSGEIKVCDLFGRHSKLLLR